MAKPIYLDHNATTPVRPEVLEAMLPFFKNDFGNPNSVYFLGQQARKAVEQARERVAAFLGAAEPQEIVFTSCGSESDVAAISGAAWAAFEQSGGAKRHAVSTVVEHDAVRGILGVLRRQGFEVDWASVDASCRVDPAEISRLIKPQTAVVSVMHANNEVGSVQPISQIAAICREKGVLFHTDAVQSAGKLPLDAGALGIDLLAISGHKINAPKGVGALYIRKGTRLFPTITGHQEKNRRGGTENVAGIVGLGTACELAQKEMKEASSRYEEWRGKLARVVAGIADSRLNGHPAQHLSNCAHFSFKGLDGHHLVVALDQHGICVSSGPACSSGSSEPSHVLTAMGIEREWATGSIRVSWGHGTTSADIEALAKELEPSVSRLRQVASVK